MEATRRGEFPVGVSCSVHIDLDEHPEDITVRIDGVPPEFIGGEPARRLAAKVQAFADAYNRVVTSYGTAVHPKMQVEDGWYRLSVMFPTALPAADTAAGQIVAALLRWRDEFTREESAALSAAFGALIRIGDGAAPQRDLPAQWREAAEHADTGKVGRMMAYIDEQSATVAPQIAERRRQADNDET